MKLTIIILTLFILSYQSYKAAESPCILEFKKAYNEFFSPIMKTKDSQKGSYLVIEMEKYYRHGKKTEKDTINYLFAPPKRVKMYNKSFVFFSDGNNYVIVLPSLKKIAIQRIGRQKNKEVPNPLELIKEMADVLITEKNFMNCAEFTNNKNIKCKEIILKSPLGNSKYSSVENIHFLMELNSKSLAGASIRYKDIIELREEKFMFNEASNDYTLPWDMKCSLDETIFEQGNTPRKEYKNFKIIDMRKQKEIEKIDFMKKKS